MVAQGAGKIVNIGSLTGLQPVPLRGIYRCASRAPRACAPWSNGCRAVVLHPTGPLFQFQACCYPRSPVSSLSDGRLNTHAGPS